MTEILNGLDEDSRDRVVAAHAQDRFFWLDVSLSETSVDEVLEAVPLPAGAAQAVLAQARAHSAPRLRTDGGSLAFTITCFVATGTRSAAPWRSEPVEVHVVITADCLVTLHSERLSLPAALEVDVSTDRSRRYVVYAVLDAMLASAFDALQDVERRLDALTAAWARGAGDRVSRATLGEIAARLATMRRWVTAQEVAFERLAVEIGALPGFDTDTEPAFDRLDEQASRLLTSIDAVANGMATLVSLQLNERAYLVSVLATIFVPLTFITGFFGMNFGWMVGHIDTPLAFVALGLIVPAVAAGLSWRLLAGGSVPGGDR
jgi:magnesium transporter